MLIAMASSSQLIKTYDVFVSFRGEDTRNNFVGFLFQALRTKNIDVFRDDEDLKKGESIAPELLQAIQGSRIFIAVFSKNYAFSTWCLRELAEICKCVETSPRSVLPIFYDVDPSDVRKQSGCYEKVFAEHEERFRESKEKMEEVQRWREALTHVANLSGWDIRNKQQYAEIEQIVQYILNILRPNLLSLPNDDLVGVEKSIEELANVLCLESVDDVRVVGISGMGGIGKTTIARALYERISHQYDSSCFIDDVSKIYRDSSSLGLQKQLLSQSLKEKNLEICNASDGTCLVWTRLHNAKALLVLDNVDQVEQLRMFTGNRNTLLRECLGGGSRIIIISRDEHVLRTHGVDDVYQVQPLNHENALQLFCKNAFNVNYILSEFQMLAGKVLSHAQGHPLAIKVIGSSLFGRNVSQWKSAMARLEENKSRNIMDVLRISFDQLDEGDKEIFLDIACFFWGGCEAENVNEVLNFRGFHPEYGIQVLVDKSLVTIDNYGWINMHRLLSDLGKCIVREKSPKEPIKRSRLWDFQDLHNALLDNQATENLEAIVVSGDEFNKPIKTTMMADGLSKIKHLKLLYLENLNFSGSLVHLSNELGYLTWTQYPFECLPPSFQPDKLVELNLGGSNIQRLWTGKKPLHNLKRLNLSFSKNLVEMPDLGDALNLERLDLVGCIQLKKINPSVGLLRKLAVLNLTNCINLVSLPKNLLGLTSLEYLSVSGCSKLYNNQLLDERRNGDHLKKLCLVEALFHSETKSSLIKKMVSWPLDLLYSRAQREPVSCLTPSSPTLPCLRELDLSFSNLVHIPDAIGKLHCLERLNLKGNNFVTLPSLKDLFRLYSLNLQHCTRLKYCPDLPSRIDLSSKRYSQLLPFDPIVFLHQRDEIRGGLSIFNCPELVDRERCTSMGFSWMIKFVQASHQCRCLPFSPFGANVESIIPGNEIPRWFNNEHVSIDNSIIIDASSVAQDNYWIGVVCCVIFQIRKMTSPTTAPLSGDTIPVDVRRDLLMDESDHMWLFYFSRQAFIKGCNGRGIPNIDGLKMKIKIRDMEDSRDLCVEWGNEEENFFPEFWQMDKKVFPVEVKKYGYRWVSEQDLKLSNATMMYGGNLTTRKRKFLAMEENK
ncbi:unnamed protein product [Sphenostylis stenocarpa]|uniref:TIR domain-containing protein n=1 Tax=Sphenostylis stenocarpa TaxID=92480 RepID=A0AA86W5P2_9FABA|nr:unnamed protein product [Sphenostylis stenocarpa]